MSGNRTMPQSDILVRLVNLKKTYFSGPLSVPVLKGINFEVKKGTFNENDFVPLKALCCCLKLHTFLFFEKRRHIFNKFFDVPLIHQFSGLTVDFCQMEAAVIDCK